MAAWPSELRRRVIERLRAPDSPTLARITAETGVPNQTLCTWRQNALRGKFESGDANGGAGGSAMPK